jgi:hypothetical protein
VMLEPDLSGLGIDRAYVQLLITNALNQALPRTIVMPYAGSLLNIPEGWQLCDGTNGTPDLRDRFVVAAGPTRPHLTTGGTSSATTSAAGAHNHGGQTGEHALSLAQIPPHTHQIVALTIGEPGAVGGVNVGNGTVDSGSAGEGEAHRHSITSAPNHTHSVTVNPPYFALAFIARTGFFTTPPEVGDLPPLTDAALRADMTVAVDDETSELIEKTAAVSFRMLRDRVLDGLRITLNSASTSGVVTVDVNVSGSTILATKLTIDEGDLSSRTATIPAVLTTSTISDDALVTVDIDTPGTGATGLKIHFLMRYAA